MNVPTGGRVVIVDDKIAEIETLMRALSQNGVAFTYFDGNVEDLPSKPLKQIAYMFLDLELDKDGMLDDKTKAAQDVNVIRKILGNNNFIRSVVIIVWSGALSILHELQSLMGIEGIKPLALLQINKVDCKSEETGDFIFEKVVQQIQTELSKIPSLSLLTMWDNFVGMASRNIYGKMLPYDVLSPTYVNKHLNSIYKQLAIASLGEKRVTARDADTDQMLAVIDILSSILSNNVSNICRSEELRAEIDLKDVVSLESTDRAQINAGINIITPSCDATIPGCIFANKENELTEEKVNGFDIFENKEDVKRKNRSEYESMLSVCCEVTPLCDYAQKRYFCHRIVSGLIVPATLSGAVKKKAEYLYKSPIFLLRGFFEDKPFFIEFDFRRLSTLPIKKLKDIEPLFQLGDPVIMHLQNRLGRQVSNPGITFIDVEETKTEVVV